MGLSSQQAIDLDGSSNHRVYERTSNFATILSSVDVKKPFLDIFANSKEYRRDYSKLFLEKDNFKIMIEGVEHMFFSDNGILNEMINIFKKDSEYKDYLGVGTLHAEKYLLEITSLIQSFFDKYLKNKKILILRRG
jgi:hypothetical protein